MKIALVLSLVVMAVLSAPSEHEVPSLKGFYDFSKEFKMYSGYLTLQETPLIKAHYVFITSKNKPQSSDVVLWSNGGPGCSSLIGFLTQIGPHILYPGSQSLAPSKNPYSWNNNANILFFQSPPGVGFSINNDPNYKYNDTKTAKDSLQSIKEWFKLFPEYSMNKFWISGESYCGMYIPLLTDQILKDIDNILPKGKLNFQGILIGNGVMNTESYWRRQARNTFYSRHYFFGTQIKELLTHCHYDASDSSNPVCIMGNKLADQAVRRINPYNSIGICYEAKAGRERRQRKFWYSAFDEQMYNVSENELGCSSDDHGMHIYFNDQTVQQQLHVPNTIWEPCSDTVGQNFKKDLSTLELFDSFKTAGLKILLFTGNVDAQVSYIETQEYVRRIGWKQLQPKRSVKNPRGSLQAWYTNYDGLTMYIVNGAGHMVPTDKPAAALRMFQSFIGNKL